jgi:glutamate synthase domain-containing protein 3
MAGALATRRAAGPARAVDVLFQGSAGQSFGAFAVDGMRLVLEGEANDGVGKGMSGGEIVIRPRRRGEAGVLAGNALLYGATGGRLFVAGRVGERFAVRNSGALAVVEGAGDHACEYMTGGAVLVLGPLGRNFAAGMSGGLAYVFDPEGLLSRRINRQMVTVEDGVPEDEEAWLREGVAAHAQATGSPWARDLMARWAAVVTAFRRVAPLDVPATVPARSWRAWEHGRPAREGAPAALQAAAAE